MSEEIYLSRGLNYLGELGAKLRDLRGTSTLAHELVQNAEDAIKGIACPSRSQATITFHIDQDALTVDNGGVFSDCGQQELRECPWKHVQNRPCDFHSFRDIGGAAKRRANSESNQGLKGAFGFGFTAVYQVTDNPNLISSGRHWILEDDKPEDKRIRQCKDPICKHCKQKELPGTRFILPWAFDGSTPVRQGLGAGAVAWDHPRKIAEELIAALPKAILFLDHLLEIKVYVDGKQELVVSVSDRSQKEMFVTYNDQRTKWLVLPYDFGHEALQLLAKHPRGEKKPSSLVKIAVPQKQLENGVFFAFLPTQDSTGVPFHVHADFFPSNDRKRVLLENDYQGEWNRAAIKAAAKALAGGIDELRNHLGPDGFWRLINCVKHQTTGSSDIDGHFWLEMAPLLQSKEVIPTSSGAWRKPSETRIPTASEQAFQELHRQLDINTVHPALLSYDELLRSKDVGVGQIDVDTLANQLRQKGFIGTKSLNELPEWFRSNMELLWSQIQEARSRQLGPETPRIALRHPLRTCSVVLCTDGKFREPQDRCFSADAETQALFARLDPYTYFAESNNAMQKALDGLIGELGPLAAVTKIDNFFSRCASSAETCGILFAVLPWLDKRVSEFAGNSEAVDKIRALPIYLTVDGWKASGEVVRPGGFRDPIGVTSVLDAQFIQDYANLIELIDVRELTLEEYICKFLPKAFGGQPVHPEKCFALLDMLATHQGSLYELGSFSLIRDVLRALPVVECEDGVLRAVRDCLHAPLRWIKGIIAADGQYVSARLWRDKFQAFLEKLGVRTSPELKLVVDRIATIANRAVVPTAAAIEEVAGLVEHISTRLDELKENSQLAGRLGQNRWVPCEKKRWNADKRSWQFARAPIWSAPSDVHGSHATCIESVATFSRLPTSAMGALQSVFKAAGLKFAPVGIRLVIKHIENCSQVGAPPSDVTYQYLAKLIKDGSLISDDLQKLRHLSLFYDAERQVGIKPMHCFLEDHGLGQYRMRLSVEFTAKHSELINALGIKAKATWEDALDVLREIADIEEGHRGEKIPEESRKVLRACWRMLNMALEDRSLEPAVRTRLGEFKNRYVVCLEGGRLAVPNQVFLRDRENLAKLLESSLGPSLIPLVQNTTAALTAIGVRKLSEVTDTRVRTDDNAVMPCPEVFGRLQERKQLLESIVETQRLGRRRATTLRLDQLVVLRTDQLVVEITVHDLDRPIDPILQRTLAAIDPAANTLLYCLDEGIIPWDAIACELAKGCFNSEDVAQLAAAFNAAVEPQTLPQATRKLSQLGFPNIELQRDDDLPASAILRHEAVSETAAHTAVELHAIPTPPVSPHTDPAMLPATEMVVPTETVAVQNGLRATGYPSSTDLSDFSTAVPTVVLPVAKQILSSTNQGVESQNALRSDSRTSKLSDILAAQAGAIERRRLRIGEASAQLPRRTFREVTRQVREAAVPKAEILQYLSGLYCVEQDLVCQMKCDLDDDLHRMPYRRPNHEISWVRTELFNREFSGQLSFCLPENLRLYLFLCPNCAAIYRDFIANSVEEQTRLYKWVTEAASQNKFKLDCSLGGIQPNRELHFHPKHLDDIRAVSGIGQVVSGGQG